MILDFPIDIRIRLVELKFFLLLPDFANSLPSWLSQQTKLSKPTGQKISKVQILNNLGFIVSDLMYIIKSGNT